jgi:hypothetical protein
LQKRPSCDHRSTSLQTKKRRPTFAVWKMAALTRSRGGASMSPSPKVVLGIFVGRSSTKECSHPPHKFGNECKHLLECAHISAWGTSTILHFLCTIFILFNLRSTTEQMPALVMYIHT